MTVDNQIVLAELNQLISYIKSCSVEELPHLLSTCQLKKVDQGEDWNPVFDRFHQLYQDFISKYGLDSEDIKITNIPDKEIRLICSCLDFTVKIFDETSIRHYKSRDMFIHMIKCQEIDVVVKSTFMLFRSVSFYGLNQEIKNNLIKRCLTFATSFPPSLTLSDGDRYPDVLSENIPAEWKRIDFRDEIGNPLFHMECQTVAELSLHQILTLGMQVISQKYWSGFCMAVWTAKSFQDNLPASMELREKLLLIWLTTMSQLAKQANEDYNNILNSNPSLISRLIELLLPESHERTLLQVYSSAINAVSCLRMMRRYGHPSRVQDIFKVDFYHQCLKLITKQQYDDDSLYREKGFSSLISMLSQIFEEFESDVCAPIIEELLHILKWNSTKHSDISAVIPDLEYRAVIHAKAFLDEGVIEVFVNCIVEHVDLAIQTSHLSVDQKKCLLKLLPFEIIGELPDNSIRELFESPLLEKCSAIFANVDIFGDEVTESALSILTNMLEADPVHFSSFEDGNVLLTLFQNIQAVTTTALEGISSLIKITAMVYGMENGRPIIDEYNVISSIFTTIGDFKFFLEDDDCCVCLGDDWDAAITYCPSLQPLFLNQLKRILSEVPTNINGHLAAADSKYSPGEYFVSDKEMEMVEYIQLFLDIISSVVRDYPTIKEGLTDIVTLECWIPLIRVPVSEFDYYGRTHQISSILEAYDSLEVFEWIWNSLKSQVSTPLIDRFMMYTDPDEIYFDCLNSKDSTTLMREFLLIHSYLNLLFIKFFDNELVDNELVDIELVANFDESDFALIARLFSLFMRCSMEILSITENLPVEIAWTDNHVLLTDTELPPIIYFTLNPRTKTETVHKETDTAIRNKTLIRSLVHKICGLTFKVMFGLLEKPTLNKTVEARTAIHKILLSLGNAFTSELDRLFANEFKKQAHILTASNFILTFISCKEEQKRQINPIVVLPLIQSGLFEKLKLEAEAMWGRLLENDSKDIEAAQSLTYISTDEVSVMLNGLHQIFLIFERMVGVEGGSSASFLKNYFGDGYKDQANNLSAALEYQLKLQASGLVQKLIGGEFAASLLDKKRVLSVLVEQLLRIARKSFEYESDIADIALIRLTTQLDSPKFKKVEFLDSLGIKDDQTEDFLKNGFELSDLLLDDNATESPMAIDVKESTEKSIIESDSVDTNMKPFARLKQPEGAEVDEILRNWISLTQNKFAAIDIIGEILLRSQLSFNEIVKKVSKIILNSNGSYHDGYCILFGKLLAEMSSADNNTEDIIEISKTLVVRFKTSTNESSVISWLSILEQILILQELNYAKQISGGLDVVVREPPLIGITEKKIIVDKILCFEEVHEFDIASIISRILILLADEEGIRLKIRGSNLLRLLVSNAKEYYTASVEHESYRTTTLILFRRIFEDSETVRDNLAVIVKSLDSNDKKEASTSLNASSILMMREPQLFTEEISKNTDVTDDENSTDFFHAEQIPNSLETSSTMSILIDELINVVSQDWISEPRDTNGKVYPEFLIKTSRRARYLENSNYSYACFLFQTIIELLNTYWSAKLEFVKTKFDEDRGLERSNALRFIIFQLNCTPDLEEGSSREKSRLAFIKSLAKLSIIALVSTPSPYQAAKATNTNNWDQMDFIHKQVSAELVSMVETISEEESDLSLRSSKLESLLEVTSLLLSTTGKNEYVKVPKEDLLQLALYLQEMDFTSQISTRLSALDLFDPIVIDMIVKFRSFVCILGDILADSSRSEQCQKKSTNNQVNNELKELDSETISEIDEQIPECCKEHQDIAILRNWIHENEIADHHDGQNPSVQELPVLSNPFQLLVNESIPDISCESRQPLQGPSIRPAIEPLEFVLLRSTTDRWSEYLDLLLSKHQKEVINRITLGIIPKKLNPDTLDEESAEVKEDNKEAGEVQVQNESDNVIDRDEDDEKEEEEQQQEEEQEEEEQEEPRQEQQEQQQDVHADEEDVHADEDNDLMFGMVNLENDVNKSNSTSTVTKNSLKTVFIKPLIDEQGIRLIIHLLFTSLDRYNVSICFKALEYIVLHEKSRNSVMRKLMSISSNGLVDQNTLQQQYTLLGVSCEEGTKIPIRSNTELVAMNSIKCIKHLVDNSMPFRFEMLKSYPSTSDSCKEPTNQYKYPINDMIDVLHNKDIRNNSIFMNSWSNILRTVTDVLPILVKNEEEGKTNPIGIPVILEINQRRIVQLLTEKDMASNTVSNINYAILSISLLPGSIKILNLEFCKLVITLSQDIYLDLRDVVAELSQENTFTVKNTSYVKFLAEKVNHKRLLMISTLLSCEFSGRDSGKIPIFYNNLPLLSLWSALSDSLSFIDKRPELQFMIGSLFPLLESFMLLSSEFHDNSSMMSLIDKRIDSFRERHINVLKNYIGSNFDNLIGPSGSYLKVAKLLDFETKKKLLDYRVKQGKQEEKYETLKIRRDNVFLDSYKNLSSLSGHKFRDTRFDIHFEDEPAFDGGGVTREWYLVMTEHIVSPSSSLFESQNGVNFYPKKEADPEHLNFVGRFIGKAVVSGVILNFPFSYLVYKRMLGGTVSFEDLKTHDPEYYNSLKWILENEVNSDLMQYFSVTLEQDGESKTIDLIPDGKNVSVTEVNKHEFVNKMTQFLLEPTNCEQILNILDGFYEILPSNLIDIFDESEMELLICGEQVIDLDDWKENTRYYNYSATSPQVQWFWEAVESFDNGQRRKLLQFATGNPNGPLGGFKNLGGAKSFLIHRLSTSGDRLPTSHTCENQIELPSYNSYEKLRKCLVLAITEGNTGFAFG